ncbi:hypothetical protein L208DRAFT_783541 [Tricholoma matsutake]|nr:hypothetical protein L208DRAFT_783541 [Tricholoma matsutake 945]
MDNETKKAKKKKKRNLVFASKGGGKWSSYSAGCQLVVVVVVAVSCQQDDVAVSTRDPPCNQQLAVAGAGAGLSFVVTCFKGRLLAVTWWH